jgi:hypothetical protein
MGLSLIPVADKQFMAKKVGAVLVKHHGKKPHYTASEVKLSARRLLFPETWDCWALSMFCSPGEFSEFHTRIGEVCDYSSMHQKMVDAVSSDSALPEVLHHVSAATESSWFSDLLGLLDTVDMDHVINHVNIDP